MAFYLKNSRACGASGCAAWAGSTLSCHTLCGPCNKKTTKAVQKNGTLETKKTEPRVPASGPAVAAPPRSLLPKAKNRECLQCLHPKWKMARA